MDPIMTAIAPNYSNRTTSSSGKTSAADRHAIVTDDYARALALARDEKKLLLVNFTGIT